MIWFIIIGYPIILGLLIFWASRKVWKRLDMMEERITAVTEELKNTKREDEKLITKLKEVITAQDEQISVIKSRLFQ